MKATGVIRRLDDLWRLTIPREIGRGLRIYSGDRVEFFTDKDCIIIKKYSPEDAKR